MSLTESIESHGPCAVSFQPTAEDINTLLAILSNFSRDFAMGVDTRLMFDGLLDNFLSLTNSEYGFIGERMVRPTGAPYLKTHAITNIAWNKETVAFYEEHAPSGMEFDNLNTLFGRVIRTGRPLISNDPSTDHRAGGLPAGHPALAAFMGIPLFLGKRFLGMAGIANRPGGYCADIFHYLDPLIGTTAALIHAAQMEKVAGRDALTGLANRRLLGERFTTEVSRQKRHGTKLSALLIDIDNFKNINENFGHMVGDRCLIHVSEILSGRIRTEDLVARYGGEEFIVLLPDTSAHDAAALAEQLRVSICRKPYVMHARDETIKITVSIGVASLQGKEKVNFEALMKQADDALYKAKKRGRNQVCCAQDESIDG